MSRTLGLDIGTNSIGWCLVEDGKRIIDMGSRIFPVGVKEDSYAKSGTEESRNAARRAARALRRGYDRRRQRRAELERILSEHGMMFDKAVPMPTKQLYGLRRKGLDERLELQEFGRILYLLNSRRGFKSSRKAAKSGDEEKEEKGMKAEMSFLEEKVRSSGARTVGEYFAMLFDNQPEHWHNPNEPVERIRKRHVRRKLYEEEFEALWSSQSRFHPWLTEELKVRIRDRVIFFQRKLKSAKHLVSKCRFEPAKRVMPRSHPAFQEFRIWQRLNDIRITTGDRVNDPLTNLERGTLAAQLGTVEDMSLAAIKKLLDLHRSTTFNDIGEKVKGNTTVARIMAAVGDAWYWQQSPEQRFTLWHVLYFAEDDGWLERHAREKLGMNDEQAMAFAAINLEPDYGSISYKAAHKMLPYLIDGYDLAGAAVQAGYHHSQGPLDDPDRKLDDKVDTTKVDALRNPLVQMCVNETARLVNAIMDAHGRPDQIRVELLRELKKPKAVREGMRRRLLDKERLRDEYRQFLIDRKLVPAPRMSDLKKFELWLELEYSTDDLAKLDPQIDLKAFARFAEAVSPKDKDKFRLWLECGRISPYTGSPIPLSKLFTEEVHVEHILPYSRSLDDSFANKTLCEAHVNEEKEGLTPLEYFERKRTQAELKAFKQRVRHFNQGKLDKFLAKEVKDDFLNSQLTNSAYIGTEVRTLLRHVCKDVRVTNGQLTGLLRRVWKLNELLNNEDDRKNRDDHRHHAVDALVIATTGQNLVQRISTESKFDFRGVQRVPDIGLPWADYRIQAAEHLNGLLVSYKGGKRLLSSKLNKYRHSKAHQGKPEKFQRTVAIRGPLHEQTLYGRITITGKGTKEETYVVRKPLTALSDAKQLEQIVDPVVRKTLKDHVAVHGGNVKEAMKHEVLMPVKKEKAGLKVPIRNVRLRVSTEEMVELRPGTFVETGNNYCIAIYEDERGKRAYRTVSFFEAAKRARQKLPLYPAEVDGKKHLMTLQQRDMVVLYDQSPDEIQWDSPNWLAQHLYMVRSFDRTGDIVLARHNAARTDPKSKEDRDSGRAQRFRRAKIPGVKVALKRTGKLVRVL
jgi:CRISPR-associated endonuclease Csn1